MIFVLLRLDLDPFRLEDTMGFVRHAVAAAGARTQLFDDPALVRLHELSDGRVALAAMLADLALLASAHAGAKRVSADFRGVGATRDHPRGVSRAISSRFCDGLCCQQRSSWDERFAWFVAADKA